MTEVVTTPIDTALAELGTMVRRARSETLTPPEFAARAERLGEALAADDVDPRRHLRALLDMLIQAAAREAEGGEPVGLQMWIDVTSRLRVELLVRRARQNPPRPNFQVVPTGIHGRRVPVLTVFDGGRP